MNRSNQNYPTSPSRTNLGLFAWQLEMRPTLSLLGGMCLSIPSGRLLPLSLRRYSFPWALRISHASSYTYQNFMHMVQTVYCQVFCLSEVMIPSSRSKKKKKEEMKQDQYSGKIRIWAHILLQTHQNCNWNGTGLYCPCLLPFVCGITLAKE